MLVLTRRVQESIDIGDNVRITVVRITGNSVRLAIEAPDDVNIKRSELPPVAKLVDASVDGIPIDKTLP